MFFWLLIKCGSISTVCYIFRPLIKCGSKCFVSGMKRKSDTVHHHCDHLDKLFSLRKAKFVHRVSWFEPVSVSTSDAVKPSIGTDALG